MASVIDVAILVVKKITSHDIDFESTVLMRRLCYYQ